jgi:DNA-directed RNA polymerase specialized sigma24 family protein
MFDYIRAKYHGSSYILETNLLENYFENVAAEDAKESKSRSEYKKRLRVALKSILSKMKPKYAKVLDLRFNQMNSVNEAAGVMNVTTNNLKVLQHRAIKQAKAIWNNLPEDEKAKSLKQKQKDR